MATIALIQSAYINSIDMSCIKEVITITKTLTNETYMLRAKSEYFTINMKKAELNISSALLLYQTYHLHFRKEFL